TTGISALENRRWATIRGFKSHLLRHIQRESPSGHPLGLFRIYGFWPKMVLKEGADKAPRHFMS
ncbi:hypothetical protein, partial [Aeromonas veronii]